MQDTFLEIGKWVCHGVLSLRHNRYGKININLADLGYPMLHMDALPQCRTVDEFSVLYTFYAVLACNRPKTR